MPSTFTLSNVLGRCFRLISVIFQDAEAHGGEKRISSSISMLERNKIDPPRGDVLLRYAACTPEDCQYMLGKPLYKDQKGIR